MNFSLSADTHTIKARALAKINLFLNIVDKKLDGYHLLESLFVPLPKLYDEITIAPASEVSCTFEGGLQIEDNIVLKVAEALKSSFNITHGARITIKKHIPIAAGLGGGSSNAATTLKLLCKLWNICLPYEKMINFAVKIGADVPFFIEAKTAFVQGIGEIITPIHLDEKLHLLLVNPGIKVNTALVYKKGFSIFSPRLSDINPNTIKKLIFSGKNDMEANAMSFTPEISKVLTLIANSPGCQAARMSGSGATCFGLFDNIASAKQALCALPSHWWHHYETLTI